MSNGVNKFPIVVTGSLEHPEYSTFILTIVKDATNEIIFSSPNPTIEAAIYPSFVNGTSPPSGWTVDWNPSTLTWTLVTDNTVVELNYQAVPPQAGSSKEGNFQEDDPVIRTGAG